MKKNIKGVGTDIADIQRFSNLKKGFAEKVFTERERDYCLSQKNPAQHFAARFAGKEAVIKALGKSEGDIGMNEIEIVNDSRGKPLVSLPDRLSKHTLLLSLSHSRTTAVAFAVALGD